MFIGCKYSNGDSVSHTYIRTICDQSKGKPILLY